MLENTTEMGLAVTKWTKSVIASLPTVRPDRNSAGWAHVLGDSHNSRSFSWLCSNPAGRSVVVC